MNSTRFKELTNQYPQLQIALLGDFCLDRYLEIDPTKAEISLETGLPVHNVVSVRSQPGGAGTILNNLVALGIGTIHPVGFIGRDGEGYELRQAIRKKRGVHAAGLVQTAHRRTFTYAKPLIVETGKPPVELNRLDSKNWTPTPFSLQNKLASIVRELAGRVHALILLEQVDQPETGVITERVLQAVAQICREHPQLLILADSRRGLRTYPPVSLKMNLAELETLTQSNFSADLASVQAAACKLARHQGRPVFVTLAEKGIIAATPNGPATHEPARPVRGEIDIVGAGDAVTANLTASLAAGATVSEALQFASAAASIVIHQLGTTGTATVSQIEEELVALHQTETAADS